MRRIEAVSTSPTSPKNASPRLLPTALTSTRFRPVIQGLRLTWYDVSNHQCADRVERAQNGGVEGTNPAEANESDTHTPGLKYSLPG